LYGYRAKVTFGLNALSGRHHIRKNWGDAWNSTNTRDFIAYTISKGYQIDSWEFGNRCSAVIFLCQSIDGFYSHLSKCSYLLLLISGNELSGHGIGARVDAKVYGEDLIGLRSLLDELYKNSQSRVLLLAPGGFFDQQWYAQFLQVSGPRVVDAVTHHIYNLGGGGQQFFLIYLYQKNLHKMIHIYG